jgi:bla regulator protein BlaR1
MRKMLALFLFMSTLFVLAMTHGEATTVVQRNDLEKYFAGYTGTFVLFDEQKNEYTVFNETQSEKRISPCSTFKIYNSLIGLETGVIKDGNTLIKWDGTIYPITSWNQDHTLATAIANSVVWYYRELASRVGPEKMQNYIDKIPYGNRDISGGINKFWLSSSLKISAQEQVELLKRLYADDLPFSQENMAITKKIIVLSSNDHIVFSGKTGAGATNGKYVLGWFVGEIENNGHRYFFATNIEADNNATGVKAKEISKSILTDMGLL